MSKVAKVGGLHGAKSRLNESRLEVYRSRFRFRSVEERQVWSSPQWLGDATDSRASCLERFVRSGHQRVKVFAESGLRTERLGVGANQQN
ncbi:MAG: hypothetical protein IT435_00050 [Phycisphaerales bacterium]|nr:hypothetical protein [Phycisphaerales bacterium]